MLLTARGQTARHGAAGTPRGFTLIETSIALLVIMVALLALASLFAYGINYNSAAHVRAVAMAVAQQRMESLRRGGFDEVVSSSEPDVRTHCAIPRTVSISCSPETPSIIFCSIIAS